MEVAQPRFFKTVKKTLSGRPRHSKREGELKKSQILTIRTCWPAHGFGKNAHLPCGCINRTWIGSEGRYLCPHNATAFHPFAPLWDYWSGVRPNGLGLALSMEPCGLCGAMQKQRQTPAALRRPMRFYEANCGRKREKSAPRATIARKFPVHQRRPVVF